MDVDFIQQAKIRAINRWNTNFKFKSICLTILHYVRGNATPKCQQKSHDRNVWYMFINLYKQFEIMVNYESFMKIHWNMNTKIKLCQNDVSLAYVL